MRSKKRCELSKLPYPTLYIVMDLDFFRWCLKFDMRHGFFYKILLLMVFP
jgi:hypothetical protein